MRWGAARLLLVVAALLAGARPCARAPLCACRRDQQACSDVPFQRFPDTAPGVAHVSLAGARLHALGDAALDGRRLRTLVLVASRLHHIERHALQSMVSTLASLDLGFNEFTELPLESLRELKVLNWLNLQNNYISDLEPHMDWGALADSLSSLTLSNNHLVALEDGALSELRVLAHLDLDGNRLHTLAGGALPPSLALLRLSDNLLQQLPCAALAHLPRLRHLHLRNNRLHPTHNRTCRTQHSKIDSLDISHNELDDLFELEFQQRLQLKQLMLDFNEFTSVPSFVLDSAHLEKLSIAYNRVSHLSDATVHALRRDLERLDLDHNELAALPACVVQLTRLRHLSLAYNRLQQLDELPPQLHSLSLAGNFLAVLPVGLRGLAPATLIYLDVGYNQITWVGAESFGAWSDALVTLNLRGNRLAQLSVDAFPATLPLRELMLSFNELYHIHGAALARLPALQVLELSSALSSGEFPLAAPSATLSWLSLDNNNIHYISSENIQNFPSLEYLNLDFNKIIELPSEVSGTNCSCRLKELRLSYNYISKINSEFLLDLKELQSVDLSYNRLHNISDHSFANLRNLVYLNLAGNALEFVAERAFSRLPKLQVLDLRDNHLVEFSSESFENVSSEESNLSVNASYNRISSLVGGGPPLLINILDLSHNLLESLSKAFFDSLGPSLRQIVLTHNRLTHIDNFAFGALPQLEILILHHNNISAVKRRAFGEVSVLQILDLSHNRLAQLVVEQFSNMRRLRHLRLAANELRALPRDAFRNTVLEHLDLQDNQLSVFPGSALAQVGFTLRRLELARNRLEYLDAAMFHTIAFLHELSLARNTLTVLADNTFAGLARLRRLDLSHNQLKANFKELFHNLPRLRRLALASAGLKSVPHLPLANLTELDLSGNYIASYREADVRRLASLRVLDVARNRFTSLQPAMWAAIPRLTSLDVSHNPLVRMAHGSFEGLHRLLNLRMFHLHHLEAIEPRAFRPLASLRSLGLESLAVNGRVEVSLADIAARTPGLETLEVFVRESVLDAQLSGLRAPKLRELSVRGAALRRVSGAALSALGSQRALVLRVSGTGLRALPAGLLRPLARVPHLALELSDNQLVSFAPTTLYPNLTGWNRLATKLLSEILILHHNNISAVKRRAFGEVSVLQILDLSHNRLAQLVVEQFSNMRRLRHLRLAANELRALPRDAFRNTVLEHLDLQDNQLSVFPGSALAQVGFTLRRLELARNRLEYLDAAMFHTIAFLHELSLARNTLTVLADNTFAGLARLRRLDLSHNQLKANFKELFHNLPRLRRLALASAGLKSVPHLPLANLTELDLSGNYIASYREADVRRLASLRVLDVARNRFTSLQPAMWAAIPRLTSLDVSHNPLVRMAHGSFEGLHRLLNLRGLVVSGNPLRCGCSVSWVGAWLRRWTAEVGGWSAAARGAARRSTCSEGGEGAARRALLALEADEAACHASALSSRAQVLATARASALWVVLLHALS